MRAHNFFIATALLSLTAASSDTTTVSLFLLGFDAQNLVGSVVGSDATATTYDVYCASTVASGDCGLPPPGVTIVEGPATVSMWINSPELNGTVECSLGGTTTADCTGSVEGRVTSTSLTGAEVSSAFLPVVVTAGQLATTGASPAASTPNPTGATKTANGSGSPSMSASVSSSTHSNGAAAKVLRGSMMGGVVAAAAAVALL